MNPNTPMGVALGGGGVRGLAHVLALEILDDAELRPAALAGTSMGAIIGALYASGKSGRQIRELIEQHRITRHDDLAGLYRKRASLLRWLSAVQPAWGGAGLLNVDGFLQHLVQEIRATTFEELAIPLQVVATDFYSGEAVVFRQGPILPAIRASMSIPGVFAPVEHDGRILVDGGMSNNLPYDLLPPECAITVAVDVAPARERSDVTPPSLVDATLGMFDMMVERITRAALSAQPPTIYVRPRLVGIRVLEFDKIDTVYAQAQPAMEEFRATIAKLKNTA